MAIVSIASAKGGVGKSTLAILLGAEFALDGYRVTLLDCDLNQHAAAFGIKAKLPSFSVVPNVGEVEVLKALRKAEADSDVVLVDLPGGSSTLAIKALQRSHLKRVDIQALDWVKAPFRGASDVVGSADVEGPAVGADAAASAGQAE